MDYTLYLNFNLTKINAHKDVTLKAHENTNISLLVPDQYTLLQLHVLIMSIFKIDYHSYSSHLFKMDYPNKVPLKEYYGEGYQLSNSYVNQSDKITYMLIAKEECDGWLIELGNGVYLEHSNPFETLPTFHLGNEEIPNLFIRQLRDERVFTLAQCFKYRTNEPSQYQIQYEIDTYQNDLPISYNITIDLLARVPDKTIVDPIAGVKLPVIINVREPSIELHKSKKQLLKIPFKNSTPYESNYRNKFKNALIQTHKQLKLAKRLQLHVNATHSKRGLQCYICHHFSNECFISSEFKTCSLYCESLNGCCELCPNNEIVKFRVESELNLAFRWSLARANLIKKRNSFWSNCFKGSKQNKRKAFFSRG